MNGLSQAARAQADGEDIRVRILDAAEEVFVERAAAVRDVLIHGLAGPALRGATP